MNIYCGNNAQHPPLINGQKTLGTRNECLLKGIRIGNSLPVDPYFTLPYTPIDKTKKYCGSLPNLPAGYDRFGGLHECYSCGVGVGKRQKASRKSVKKSAKSRKSVKKSAKSRKSVKKNTKSRKSVNRRYKMQPTQKITTKNNYKMQPSRKAELIKIVETQFSKFKVEEFDDEDDPSDSYISFEIECSTGKTIIFTIYSSNVMKINLLRKCLDENGGTVLNKLITIGKQSRVSRIELEDDSHLDCDIPLAAYYILKYGMSWYNKFGFVSENDAKDRIENERIRNLSVEHFIHEIVDAENKDFNRRSWDKRVQYVRKTNPENLDAFIASKPPDVNARSTITEWYRLYPESKRYHSVKDVIKNMAINLNDCKDPRTNFFKEMLAYTDLLIAYDVNLVLTL